MTIHSSISIIIPVFNGLPYVTQAVDSVLNQTQSSWELLISDNGSTDGTHNYLQRLKTSGDRRIKIFEQDQNIGIFGNLNFLINNAEADVIQIVCADDFLSSPSSLDTILGFWNTADINTSAVRWNGKKLLSIGVPTFIKPDVSQLYFFLFGNLFGNLSCASFRKKAITAAKSFDQSYPYAGDFEFWARLAKNSSFVIHELDTVVIRAHPGQASNYLNLNGDLYPQLSLITSQIFENIGNQNRFVRLLFKITGTIIYDSQYRLSPIRHAIQGNPIPLQKLNKASKESTYALPQFAKNALFIMTFGGKLGKKTMITLCLVVDKIFKI
jgi:glycosyltransferase involved in cell wall biosynthesis